MTFLAIDKPCDQSFVFVSVSQLLFIATIRAWALLLLLYTLSDVSKLMSPARNSQSYRPVQIPVQIPSVCVSWWLLIDGVGVIKIRHEGRMAKTVSWDGALFLAFFFYFFLCGLPVRSVQDAKSCRRKGWTAVTPVRVWLTCLRVNKLRA